MVSIIKENTNNSKGLAVFTHKEQFVFENPIRPLKEAIETLKSEYLLGMHWGWYHENQGPVPYIDFHLAGEGTVSFREDIEAPRYTYCSRNFIPEFFIPFKCPTHWDIVTVATPVNKKNMSDLIDAVRKALDRGVDLTALLYCPRPIELNGRQWDREFFLKYESILSDQEKRDIELVTPVRTEDDIYPMPFEFIPYLYNSASAFTIFTKKEGECRVISEALLTGTSVIARKDLLGGGRDFLDQNNSELFESIDEAADIFIDVHNNPDKYSFDPAYLRDSLYAPQTVPKFESTIKQLFQYYEEPFDGELYTSNLNFKLPSHELTLSKEYRKSGTNDLKNQLAALKFIEYICDGDVSIGLEEMFRYQRHKILSAPSNTKDITSDLAWKVEQKTPFKTYTGAKYIYDKLK